MNKLTSALASAILLTIVSSSIASADLKLDVRHDIEPAATQSAPVENNGLATDAAKNLVASKYQTAAANHQASATVVPAKPKAQRRPRPQYVEETVVVVRPVFRPVRMVRHGRW